MILTWYSFIRLYISGKYKRKLLELKSGLYKSTYGKYTRKTFRVTLQYMHTYNNEKITWGGGKRYII